MVVDPETAPVVELFERRARGDGIRVLAKFLRERTGHPYSPQSVGRILANPVYHQGRLTFEGVVSDFEAGAIVDTALFMAVQRPPSIRDERTAKGRWLVSGLARCGSCGRSLTPWRPSRHGRKGTRPRYRCDRSHDCQARASIRADVLEAAVVEAAFAADLELVAKPAEGVDLEPLAEALALAEAQYVAIQTAESQTAFGEDWLQSVQARREARDEAAAALGSARAELGGAEGDGQTFPLGYIWDELEPAVQREALRWVFQEVRVSRVERGAEPSLEFVPRATPTVDHPALPPARDRARLAPRAQPSGTRRREARPVRAACPPV